MDSIRTKLRYLLNDNSTSGKDVFTYGSSTIFTLSESNVIAITDVYRNSVASGVTHTYDSTSNKVTITSSLTSGDTIEIDYTYYPNYSTTELTNYVQAALVHLSICNYYDFEYDSTDDAIYPTPTTKEENIISAIAELLIKPDNKSYKLPDITVNVPDDLPLHDKIRKLISVYKKDSSGLFFVE